MGPAGHVTRVCPWLLRIAAGRTAARPRPGSCRRATLIDMLPRARDDGGDGALRGRRARRSAHSASPAMHNAAFAALGHRRRLRAARDAPTPPSSSRVADALGVARRERDGAAQARRCSTRGVAVDDAVAARSARVNTLRRARDGLGRPQLRRRRVPRAARASRLSAGRAARGRARRRRRGARGGLGAARAGRAASRSAPAGRTRPRALAGDFGVGPTPWPPAPGWDLLVNTTPVGTWPAVDDVAARRARTCRAGSSTTSSTTRARRRCCEWARAAGAETIGGLEMLVAQARAPVRVVDRPCRRRRP